MSYEIACKNNYRDSLIESFPSLALLGTKLQICAQHWFGWPKIALPPKSAEGVPEGTTGWFYYIRTVPIAEMAPLQGRFRSSKKNGLPFRADRKTDDR